ncbi:hypothetical protein GCM10010249_51360 [Streptomyces roseolilacinus]|uniref:Uncharacterized protein n=1 Tax=Streptomyces roseolilacinus TaxID=66904 RepID=A0A918B4S5_9ACTN|nr:hypothetical protein GCM10010249_51360 [Streptomyces roseolilacinus]
MPTLISRKLKPHTTASTAKRTLQPTRGARVAAPAGADAGAGEGGEGARDGVAVLMAASLYPMTS